MDNSLRVKEIIADKLGVDMPRVVDSARFVDDLGADSLDQVELVMELENAFGCEIPDEQAQKMTTVKSVLDFVASLDLTQA